MSFFVDRADGGEIRVFFHPGETLRIGRGTDVELRLDDPAVELVHAVLVRAGGTYVVEDRGSVLGTLVQGERRSRQSLTNGDVIGVGTFEITVEVVSSDKPLFLHVARVGEDDPTASSVSTLSHPGTLRSKSGADLQAFAETLVLRTRSLADGSAAGSPLVAMAEAYAKARGLPTDDSGIAEPALRPPVPPREPASAELRPLPAIDYVRAYGLRRGAWLRRSTVALGLLLAVLGGLAALLASGAEGIFSPGDLAAVHQSATADRCAACHRPFQSVDGRGCGTSGCHAKVGVHQTTQIRSPSCLECHVEHSTLDRLRLLDELAGCVGCHAGLDAEAVRTRFAATITGFDADSHPPFSPREDPGNLHFNHDRHLRKLALPGTPPLGCESCHERDVEGEIRPIAFGSHCRRCHDLAFDARLGAQEAEHDTPARLLNALTGLYLRNRGVLRALTVEESNRLRGRRLDEEDQLAVVAEWNALALLRTKCRVCHDFDGRPGSGPLQNLHVEPTQLRVGWYDHAEYRHGPHLELPPPESPGRAAPICERCHVDARDSREAADLLLPRIEVCQPCHREPLPDETAEVGTLGRTGCVTCHTYHPEPGEVRDRRAAAQE